MTLDGASARERLEELGRAAPFERRFSPSGTSSASSTFSPVPRRPAATLDAILSRLAALEDAVRALGGNV
jgi:hypothetical protein